MNRQLLFAGYPPQISKSSTSVGPRSMLLPLLPASQRALVGLHVARAQVPIASLALPIATGRSALAIAGVSGGLAVGAQARR